MKKLISFIGKGRRDSDNSETYAKANYKFNDDKVITTSIFPEALMKHNSFGITEALLIGTDSSSWGCLIEEAANSGRFEDLYYQIESEFEKELVTAQSLLLLEKALAELWNIPVKCCTHTSTINEDNVMQVLLRYTNEIMHSNTKPNSEILIDITHGFRSMPIILMSSLQLLDAIISDDVGIEIIYGEFISKEQPASVRYLKPVWDGVMLARALRQFNEKFEGELLSSLLVENWPEGSKAVSRLSSVLQANFVTKLDEALRQLDNAIKSWDKKDEASGEVDLVVNSLREVHKQLSAPKLLHKRILALANYMAKRKLYGSAIITLQICLESFMFYHFKDENFGDYDITKKLCKMFAKKELKEWGEKRATKNYNMLRTTRNAIAHGGAFSPNGGTPQEASLPSQFEAYNSFVERLFKQFK